MQLKPLILLNYANSTHNLTIIKEISNSILRLRKRSANLVEGSGEKNS